MGITVPQSPDPVTVTIRAYPSQPGQYDYIEFTLSPRVAMGLVAQIAASAEAALAELERRARVRGTK